MLRRDIFNLLFNKNPAHEPLVTVADPVVNTPAYLQKEQTIFYERMWTAPLIPVELAFEHASAYAFTITLEFNAQEVIFSFGELNIGLRAGRLFIAEQVDNRVIDGLNLQGSITLVLSINPQPNNGSYAKVTALNQLGLTLATLKTTKYTITDWSAPFKTFSPISSLSIEGMQLKTENTLTPKPDNIIL